MQKIIEDAKKGVQRKSEPEDVKKKKNVDEESEIFIQACLENSTEDESGKSKLFRAKIRGIFGDFPRPEQEEQKKQMKKDEIRPQGYILLNFPNTLQEAVDLERQLSGFVHPSDLPPETRTLKKQENVNLLTGTPDKSVPITYFKSAWDIVIWLDLDENAAIRRSADRRIDPQGNVYNLSVNPPSDNILAKCKTLDTPTEEQIKNDYFKFNEQKSKLMH